MRLTYPAKIYCLLAKPGIILGNCITTAAGFALASKGHLDFLRLFETLAGLSLIIASASVFNNFIDSEVDAKMVRTKERALPLGLIPTQSAVAFAFVLGVAGVFLLAFCTNMICVAAAGFGFFVYVMLYSFLKYYTIYGTLIGSAAGAIPPVVGYCAASNRIDIGTVILFAMMALWQMPHFFAIAIYRLEDYAAASIPVLPLRRGIRKTKIQMMLYIPAFIAAAMLLTVFNYTGEGFRIAAAILGIAWFSLCLQGFRSQNDKKWAKEMFRFSLIVVTALSLMIPFSVVRS